MEADAVFLGQVASTPTELSATVAVAEWFKGSGESVVEVVSDPCGSSNFTVDLRLDVVARAVDDEVRIGVRSVEPADAASLKGA